LRSPAGPFAPDFPGRIATRIMGEALGINRIVCDVSSKLLVRCSAITGDNSQPGRNWHVAVKRRNADAAPRHGAAD
jgi:hypothetical protein